ncbi:response regulator [Shewanella sp. SR43-4]|uniref:response regulator n=1 Tax=Shewanella sp. SR43-4 TaxID=2760942 RepID=UPI0015F980FE|nr:response regulator [Shewanella sp. SR43-4]MBB1319592.1 response regulator [Shewanella sp. SR43-4]
MKFRIIWIDDSLGWVNSVRDTMREAFIEAKFDPIIEEYTLVNDEVREAINNNYLDLLIIDCNLPGINGNEFILELRSQRCFSHIIFYSENANNLRLVQADNHFSHVTPRDSFNDVIENVADQAFRKYNHPAFMRGLLLSEFIDLESLLNDLISQCFKDNSAYFRDSIINKGGESFGLGTKQQFIGRLLKDPKIINEEMKGKIRDIDFTTSNFQKNILEKRNILAHAYPDYDIDTHQIKLISAKDTTVFNADWFYETRNNIHIYKNKIKKLLALELYKVVNP